MFLPAFRDYYFDILNFKTFFYKVVIIFAVVFLMVNIIFFHFVNLSGLLQEYGQEKENLCL